MFEAEKEDFCEAMRASGNHQQNLPIAVSSTEIHWRKAVQWDSMVIGVNANPHLGLMSIWRREIGHVMGWLNRK